MLTSVDWARFQSRYYNAAEFKICQCVNNTVVCVNNSLIESDEFEVREGWGTN